MSYLMLSLILQNQENTLGWVVQIFCISWEGLKMSFLHPPLYVDFCEKLKHGKSVGKILS